MRLRSAGGVVFFFLIASIATLAQVISTSQIRGTIQDSSGAAIPGAQITLTQTSTGAVRTSTSAANGSYALPDLPVGTYRMQVTKEGFRKYTATGLILTVGVNPTVNVTLQVGSVTQEVQVNASAVMVETQSEGVGEVTPPEEIQQLPLNGRQLTDLFQFSPGVGNGIGGRPAYGNTTDATSNYAVAGSMQGGVSFWLDGASYMDPLSNQNLPLPFPDTIEEFSIETSSAPAQYGVHAGGDVNTVTKSGTNQFHGDAFDYLRNYMFDSRATGGYQCVPTPLDTAASNPDTRCPRDNLHRNQFGGTIGGPIIKNKLFFFAGWQDTVQSTAASHFTSLPTPDMLAGNFQPCLGATPALSGPFGTGGSGPNQTNPANYNPVVTALLNYLPAPNVPIGGPTACGTNDYQYNLPVHFSENQGLGRIDYHINNTNTLFGRYFISHLSEPSPAVPTLSDGNPNLVFQASQGFANQVEGLVLGDTWVLSSNLVNSAHASANRVVNRSLVNAMPVSIYDLFSQVGLSVPTTNIYQLPVSSFAKFLPSFSFGGPSTTETPSIQPYDTLEFSDDVAWTHGAHQLSFGVDWINYRAFAYNYLANQGQYTFDGSRTSSTGRATLAGDLPDFLLGETSASSGFTQDAPIPSLQHQNVFAFYAQDTWKATRKLTITAGLRWDPFLAHTVPGGLDAVTFSLPNAIASVHSKRFPGAPAGYLFDGDPGAPTGNKLTENALDKWSPRIGLAWDPRGDGRMSIRAGFGIFYDFPAFAFDQLGFEEPYGGIVAGPPGAACTSFPCNADLTNPWAGMTFITGQGATETGNPYPQYVGTGPANAAYLPGAEQFSYPQYVKPTYVMQYNLSIQKQVAKNWLLSASYVGNQMRHLWSNIEANPGMQGPCPTAYPLPGGVSCTPGPCPPTLAPFICNSINPDPLIYPISPFTLNAHRMLENYGSKCGSGVVDSCYGEDFVLDEGGTGNYNALILSAQHRFSNYTSTTNFTWAHCISSNYTTEVGLSLFTNMVPYDPNADRGNCPGADTPWVFNQAFVANMPHLSISNRFLSALANDWMFSVDGIIESGTNLSDLAFNAPFLVLDYSGSGNGFTQRPDLVAGQPRYCQPKGRSCWLNPAAYTTPAPYTFGDLSQGSLFGPGQITFNTALARTFKLTEGQSLMFRWEVFNIANHANLGLPGVAAPLGGTTPTFGEPSVGGAYGGAFAGGIAAQPRIMQFALKYSF
ncbi:MAG: TonB-dependent receptor domain-containing protein [Candidatus Acidiferrales bacterium]